MQKLVVIACEEEIINIHKKISPDITSNDIWKEMDHFGLLWIHRLRWMIWASCHARDASLNHLVLWTHNIPIMCANYTRQFMLLLLLTIALLNSLSRKRQIWFGLASIFWIWDIIGCNYISFLHLMTKIRFKHF